MELEVDSQFDAELPVQPSPVLMEAVQKVEQVVARLQSLQTTISGIHLSPVNLKHNRALKGNIVGKENVGPSGHRDGNNRKALKDYNVSCREKPEQPLRMKAEWNHWSSPANQVHDVISEILMASQFAKQIATLVAEALQERPQKADYPDDASEEPRKRLSKDGKRRDIAFPSRAQVQKTMNAKAPPNNTVNKFKVAGFPADTTVRLVPPVKPARTVELPLKSKSKSKTGPASHKRRSSRGYTSMSSSPSTLSPGSPRSDMDSPEIKRGSQRLCSSPSASFREFSDDADDELSGPRRHSMNVTEIKGPTKPWKLTPTKGVLFSNPVYLSSPRKPSGVRPSPVKIVPTTGRRNSWLTSQFPKSPEAAYREPTKSRGGPSANPLLSSISKTTFKREGASKFASKSSVTTEAIKLEHIVTNGSVVPHSRFVEMVPLDGPRNGSIVTMFDVLKVRSPPRLPAATPALPNQLSGCPTAVESNTSVTNRSAVADGEKEQDLLRRVPHSQSKSSLKVDIPFNDLKKFSTNSKQVCSAESLDKENDQVPCAPAAVMFLRNISSGHTLNRSLSRKNSGVSLIQRAKGWMSFQAVKQGRVRELERELLHSQGAVCQSFTPSVTRNGLLLCATKRSLSGRIIQLRNEHGNTLPPTTRTVASNRLKVVTIQELLPVPATHPRSLQHSIPRLPNRASDSRDHPKNVHKFRVVYPATDHFQRTSRRVYEAARINEHSQPPPLLSGAEQAVPQKLVHIFRVVHPWHKLGLGRRERPLLRRWPHHHELWAMAVRHSGMCAWLHRLLDWIASLRRGFSFATSTRMSCC